MQTVRTRLADLVAETMFWGGERHAHAASGAIENGIIGFFTPANRPRGSVE